MARWQGPIGQEGSVGVAGVGLDTDRIAQVPVVEPAEIGCRPALQVRRTGEDVRREKLVFRQWTEKLIRKIKSTADDLIPGGNEFQGTSVIGGDLRREFPAVVIRKHLESKAALPQVVHAFDAFGAGVGPAEGRQQERGNNPNDRYNRQQFDQRERANPSAGSRRLHSWLRI